MVTTVVLMAGALLGQSDFAPRVVAKLPAQAPQIVWIRDNGTLRYAAGGPGSPTTVALATGTDTPTCPDIDIPGAGANTTDRVIVWVARSTAGGFKNVYASVNGGTPVVVDSAPNVTIAPMMARVTMSRAGKFTVAWMTDSKYTPLGTGCDNYKGFAGGYVYARSYTYTAGTTGGIVAMGQPVQVNTVIDNGQQSYETYNFGDIASDDGDNFYVTYTRNSSPSRSTLVLLRRFTFAMSPLTGEMPVSPDTGTNTYTFSEVGAFHSTTAGCVIVYGHRNKDIEAVGCDQFGATIGGQHVAPSPPLGKWDDPGGNSTTQFTMSTKMCSPQNFAVTWYTITDCSGNQRYDGYSNVYTRAYCPTITGSKFVTCGSHGSMYPPSGPAPFGRGPSIALRDDGLRVIDYCSYGQNVASTIQQDSDNPCVPCGQAMVPARDDAPALAAREASPSRLPTRRRAMMVLAPAFGAAVLVLLGLMRLVRPRPF